MTALTSPRLNESTRERLLRAAGEVFAAQGFRDATVRDICQSARVNVASVNYHFRSKEALYTEVLSFAFQESQQRYPWSAAVDPVAAPERRLADFVGTFVRRLLDDSELSWQGRLIAREVMDPTAALDHVIDAWIRPRFALLAEIVSHIVGRPCGGLELHRLLFSIVGQCLVYRHARAVIDRLCPEVIASPSELDATVAHIVRFCLAGLRHSAGELEMP
jgi:AcrR family transcriptional regulator